MILLLFVEHILLSVLITSKHVQQQQQQPCCVQTEWAFIQEVKGKKIVINTPFKYKTNKNKNKHDIHFAYQRTIQ